MSDTMTLAEAKQRLARLEHFGLSRERDLAPLRSLIAVYGQLERARLELACERGERGPWCDLEWWTPHHRGSGLATQWRRGPAVVESASWTHRTGDVGRCAGMLDGIEQACDALGIATTWPRP